MANETLILLTTALSMGGALLAYKFGRRGLEAFIIASTLSLYVVAGKVVEVWGIMLSPSLPVYAGIFLATDILTEYYGKVAGYRLIRIALGAALFFNVLLQLAVAFEPAALAIELSTAMQVVLGTTARIFVASIVAYVVAQHFDVWFYHRLHKATRGSALWLRNNLSTVTSQFIDTVIFVTIAFYGVVPNLVEMVAVFWLAKALIAVLDTPFMYLTRYITPAKFESK